MFRAVVAPILLALFVVLAGSALFLVLDMVLVLQIMLVFLVAPPMFAAAIFLIVCLVAWISDLRSSKGKKDWRWPEDDD